MGKTLPRNRKDRIRRRLYTGVFAQLLKSKEAMIVDEASTSSPSTSVKPIFSKTKSNKRNLMLEIGRYQIQLINLNSKKTPNDEFIRYSDKTTVHSPLTNPAESEIWNLGEKFVELYDRFQHIRITERDLLRGLSLHCA